MQVPRSTRGPSLIFSVWPRITSASLFGSTTSLFPKKWLRSLWFRYRKTIWPFGTANWSVCYNNDFGIGTYNRCSVGPGTYLGGYGLYSSSAFPGFGFGSEDRAH